MNQLLMTRCRLLDVWSQLLRILRVTRQANQNGDGDAWMGPSYVQKWTPMMLSIGTSEYDDDDDEELEQSYYNNYKCEYL